MDADDFIIPEKKKVNIIAKFKGLNTKIDKNKFKLHGVPRLPKIKKVPIIPKKIIR